MKTNPLLERLQRQTKRQRQRKGQHVQHNFINIGLRKATFDMEIRVRSSTIQAREAKGRSRYRSLPIPRTPRRDTKDDRKGTPTGTCLAGKQGKPPCRAFQKGDCQKRNVCYYWHLCGCAKFKSPVGCDTETKCLHRHRKASLMTKRKSATIADETPHSSKNDEKLVLSVRSLLRYGVISRKKQFRVIIHHLMRKFIPTREIIWDHHLDSFKQNTIMSEVQTLRNSKNALFSGLVFERNGDKKILEIIQECIPCSKILLRKPA